ncbi:retrotransposon hot spot (RHS) protein [Trypanosoma cruzi]|nr:retrotransposon hot spot (RHS) protein [Trypanosoma cruzi]
MVLTSDKGWPYSWNLKGVESTRDCYVNCEVDRARGIVKKDLTAWSTHHGRTDFEPKQRLLIGTPGIGKSVAAGSYLLYQLLHCDAEQLPTVAHFMVSGTYLLEETS